LATALEAGYDLGAVALCFVAIALLLSAKGIVALVAKVLDFSIFGLRPLHGIATALENSVIGALDDAIRGVEKATAKFLSGLIDAFGMLIAIPALLAVGTKAGLEYLWNSALRPTIHSIADPIRTTANKAIARVTALEAAVDADVDRLERYAREHAASAVTTAEAYVDSRLSGLRAAIGQDIGAAIGTAERYADEAVGRLRAAEDAAIATAAGLALAAKAAGLEAAALAEQAAERAAGSALAQSEAAAARALAEAQAAGQAALDTVRGIAVGAADDLASIEGGLGALGVAGLIAAIPALGTLVNTIATESGLENAACRSKVKGICGTDPTAWGDLLGGLAVLGIAFNLRELVELAEPVIAELAPVIAKVAG
jgi:hypothetical protein